MLRRGPLSIIAASLICIASLMLFAVSVFAQTPEDHWRVGEADRYVSYIDTQRIETSGLHRRAWLWIFNAPSPQSPHIYMNSRVLVEFDCPDRRRRFLQGTRYSGTDVVDEIWRASEWQYAVPDSVGEREMRFVCSNAAERGGLGARVFSPLSDAMLIFSSSP